MTPTEIQAIRANSCNLVIDERFLKFDDSFEDLIDTIHDDILDKKNLHVGSDIGSTVIHYRDFTSLKLEM